MKFALDEEIREFAGTVDDMLSRAKVNEAIRAWNDGDTAAGLGLWSKLAESGAFALLLAEEHDGMGATAVEAVAVAEQLGRHAVPGPVVESMFIAPLLVDGLAGAGAETAGELAAAIAGGQPVTVAVPSLSPLAAGADVATAAFAVSGDAVSTATLGEPQRSVDRARYVAEATAGETAGSVSETAVINRGALGTAALQLGLAGAMLSMSVDYAKQRSQFGRLIGEQQAIKHKAADMAIAIEMARPLLWSGALAVAENPEAPEAAVREVSAAAVACGEAAALACRNSLQIHGAIGYTMEHDLGLLLTKSRALQAAWGSASYHRGRILAVIEAEGAR